MWQKLVRGPARFLRGDMLMIALSDSEMAIVFAAAHPLAFVSGIASIMQYNERHIDSGSNLAAV